MQQITIQQAVERIQALNQFSEETGVKLPYRAGFILAQELAGNVVDLETGAINVIPGANGRHGPTARGQEASNA